MRSNEFKITDREGNEIALFMVTGYESTRKAVEYAKSQGFVGTPDTLGTLRKEVSGMNIRAMHNYLSIEAELNKTGDSLEPYKSRGTAFITQKRTDSLY